MARPKEHGTPLLKSLGFRIALSVGVILLVSYAVFIYLVLEIQEDFYFKRVIREAERFSVAIRNATNHSMLRDDREVTGKIVSDMGKQGEISDIRIYDHEGVIKFSNRSAEVGTRADKKAEACLVCHSADAPFSEVATDKRARIYHHGGHRVLGMITPIYNNASCYKAACHVHPEAQKVLGVLDIGMSLKGFDSHRRSPCSTLFFSALGLLLRCWSP